MKKLISITFVGVFILVGSIVGFNNYVGGNPTLSPPSATKTEACLSPSLDTTFAEPAFFTGTLDTAFGMQDVVAELNSDGDLVTIIIADLRIAGTVMVTANVTSATTCELTSIIPVMGEPMTASGTCELSNGNTVLILKEIEIEDPNPPPDTLALINGGSLDCE